MIDPERSDPPLPIDPRTPDVAAEAPGSPADDTEVGLPLSLRVASQSTTRCVAAGGRWLDRMRRSSNARF